MILRSRPIYGISFINNYRLRSDSSSQLADFLAAALAYSMGWSSDSTID